MRTRRIKMIINIRLLTHDQLLLIQLAESKVEDHSRDESSNGRAAKVPCEIRVPDSVGCSETNEVCDARVEEVNGRHEATHVDWCARVRNTIGRYVYEDLRDTADSEGNGHVPDGNRRDARSYRAVARPLVAAR